jgi:hypothetical protein
MQWRWCHDPHHTHRRPDISVIGGWGDGPWLPGGAVVTKKMKERPEIERAYKDRDYMPTEELARLLQCYAEWPETFNEHDGWLLQMAVVKRLYDLQNQLSRS